MIELKAKSENYIPKEKLEKAIAGLEKARGEIDRVTAETELANLLNEDFEVEIQLKENDVLNELWEQGSVNETTDYVLANAADDHFINYLEEHGYTVKEGDDKPLLASNFNAYDFKRQMCDFFETGYHVDSFDLVKLFAEKLKVDYLL